MVEDLPEDHRKDERTASNPSHRNNNSKSGTKQAICAQKEEEEEVKVDETNLDNHLNCALSFAWKQKGISTALIVVEFHAVKPNFHLEHFLPTFYSTVCTSRRFSMRLVCSVTFFFRTKYAVPV
jgi:hypothetical protein